MSKTIYHPSATKAKKEARIYCDLDPSPIPQPDFSRLLNENKAKRRSGLITIKQIWVVDRDKWLRFFQNSEANVKAFFQVIADNIAREDLEIGIRSVVEIWLSKPGEFTKTGIPAQFKYQLSQKYPHVPADLMLYIGQGANPGIATLRGVTIKGYNYGAVLAMQDNSDKGRVHNAIKHEIRHLYGLDHNHVPVWTLEGKNGQYIDNFGQVHFPSTCGRMPAGVTPKLDLPATLMGYGAVANKPYVTDEHPSQLPIMMAYLNSVSLGIWNTAYNFKWNQDGTVSYQDDYNGAYERRFGRFAPGATAFTAWDSFASHFMQSQETFENFEVSTYKSGTPQTTGYRHYSGSVDLRDFNEIRISVPAGVKWLWSYGHEKSSYSGALTVPHDGILLIKKDRKVNYINIRPATLTALTPSKMIAARFIMLPTGNYFIPDNLVPNSWYVVQMRPVGGGTTYTAWFQTPPTNWVGAILTDSGGTSGKYENNQTCELPTIPAPPLGKKWKLTCQEWDIWDPVDYLEINGIKYFQGPKPGPIFSTGPITRLWSTNGDGTGKGWKFLLELVNI